MAGFLGSFIYWWKWTLFSSLSQDSPPRRHLQASASVLHRETGSFGMEEVGVGNPPDFWGGECTYRRNPNWPLFLQVNPSKQEEKLRSITRGPHLGSRYTLKRAEGFLLCGAVLLVVFLLVFVSVCLWGEGVRIYFAFLQECNSFWSNQKHPPKQKWWSHESCKKDHVSNTHVLFFFPRPLPNFLLLSSKLTWQQNVDLLKMYLLLKTGFQCHVSSLEGKATFTTPEN